MMRSYTSLFLWLAIFATCFAEAQTPDENGLWQIWVSQTNAPADPIKIGGMCQTFRTKAPADPLAIVAQELEAWCQLKDGKTNEAAQLLEPMVMASDKPLLKAGAEIARSWLTRVDRESVRRALKRYYIQEIEYPATLAALNSLKGIRLPPVADRWGQPWSYRNREFATIKDTPRQRYTLESTRLGASSDLAHALAVPYGERITIKPVRILGGTGAGETVEFVSATGKSAALTGGAELDGTTVAFIGKSIIVLADKDHWRVVPKPQQ